MNKIIIAIGQGKQSKLDEAIKAISKEITSEHKHNFIPIKCSSDVICSICGIKAKRGYITCPTCKSDLNTTVRKDTCFYCSQALKWR